jgi:ABC-type amino acid transport system permease subunit
MPLAGSIAFGLVWGWLLAGLDAATWRAGLALATASGIAGILVWTFAGTPSLVGLTVAALLAGLLRLGWHRSLGAHV